MEPYDMVWNSKRLLDWPLLFERNVDTDSYLELLRNWLPGLFENIDLETR